MRSTSMPFTSHASAWPLIFSALLAVDATLPASSAVAATQPASISSRTTDDTTEASELAWILAALSEMGRQPPGLIKREGPYYEAVEAHFGRFSGHPAVQALGPDASLPRLVGNAADYSFKGSKLVKRTRERPLWDDAEGDLFAAHLGLIADFAKVTNARAFLRAHRADFQNAAAAATSLVDLRKEQLWLEGQFSARPGNVRVLVSPLAGGWNWTNLDGLERRIWVPMPKDDTVNSTNLAVRMRYEASVFTELDHMYVNPVTKMNLDSVNRAFANVHRWGNASAVEQYPSAELTFNEYMTWAAFLEYARDRTSKDDFTQVEQRIVTFMQDRRGFVRFGEFYEKLKSLRGSGTTPIETLFPEVLKWAESS